MTVCSHTGITVPECSCSACIQAQIEQHMPSLLGGPEHDLVVDADGAVVSRFPRLRFASRLRQRRRRRMRRAA
jgi:hypothetical protein